MRELGVCTYIVVSIGYKRPCDIEKTRRRHAESKNGRLLKALVVLLVNEMPKLNICLASCRFAQ